MCPPARGDAFRVRNGSEPEDQDGELGEVGEGSVERRRLGGFGTKSESGTASVEALWSRRLGIGEERNSSILSVSGTGSMLTVSCRVW
jgi:hypothetical protein